MWPSLKGISPKGLPFVLWDLLQGASCLPWSHKSYTCDWGMEKNLYVLNKGTLTQACYLALWLLLVIVRKPGST